MPSSLFPTFFAFHRFLSSGGWGILNKWLNEYTNNENVPVLLEIIEVCQI